MRKQLIVILSIFCFTHLFAFSTEGMYLPVSQQKGVSMLDYWQDAPAPTHNHDFSPKYEFSAVNISVPTVSTAKTRSYGGVGVTVANSSIYHSNSQQTKQPTATFSAAALSPIGSQKPVRISRQDNDFSSVSPALRRGIPITDDDEEGGNPQIKQPVGEGLWFLLLLALVTFIIKSRKSRPMFKKQHIIKVLTVFVAIAVISTLSIDVQAKQYCQEAVTLQNPHNSSQSHTFNLTCEKIGNEYVVVAELTDGSTYDTNQYTQYWGSPLLGGSQDIHSYFTLSNNNKTLTAKFPSQPQFYANGSNNTILQVSSTGFAMPTDIEWGTCGPKYVYFVNSWGWSEPEAHCWTGSTENGWVSLTKTSQTTYKGAEIYKIEVENYQKMVFREKGDEDKKTQDIEDVQQHIGQFYNPHPEPNDNSIGYAWYQSKNFKLSIGKEGSSWTDHPFTGVWNADTSTDTKLSQTLSLDANSTYKFAIVQTDWSNYYKNSGEISSDIQDWFLKASDNDITLKTTKAGKYTFTYDMAANRLSVIFPESVPPAMNGATTQEVTDGKVIVNVDATDNVTNPVVDFYVQEQDNKHYIATDGKITITGLIPCSNQTFTIYCKDANENSSLDNTDTDKRSAQITVATGNPASTDNLALNKPATASHTESNYTGYEPRSAVDGNADNRWASGGVNDSEDVWWAVDLGTTYLITKIRIRFEARPEKCYLQGRDTESEEWTTFAERTTPVENNQWIDYTSFEGASQYRYVRILAKGGETRRASGYGMSFFEFEVYGECPVFSDIPMMTNAQAVEVRTEEADVRFTSRDNATAADDMKYYATVESLTGPKTSWTTLLNGGTDYTLRGLVPGTEYRVTVYCEDDGTGNENSTVHNSTENDNTSYQQKQFSFTTINGGGCEWTSGESNKTVKDGPDWVALPDGMSYVLNIKKYDDTHIQIDFDITYPTTVKLGNCLLVREKNGGIFEAYATNDKTEYIKNFVDEEGHRHFTAVVGNDLQSTNQNVNFWGDDWSNDCTFGVKIEWSYTATNTGGPSGAGYYSVNPGDIVAGNTCVGNFVITQTGRSPQMMTQDYDGSQQIIYYRQFTPGQWAPLIVPFEVERVEVYNEYNNQMYELSAPDWYLLRTQPDAGVSGENFLSSWANAESKPQKNKAYNIYFPNSGVWNEFYTEKLVVFRGKEDGDNAVSTSFTQATRPTDDDLYTLHGNTTLSAQTVNKAYREDNDGRYYRMPSEDSWTLQPFECYVLANEKTSKVMRVIGRWNHEYDNYQWEDEVVTSIDQMSEIEPIDNLVVYSLMGQEILLIKHTTLLYAQPQLKELPKGCYIIKADNKLGKIMIP